MAQRNLLISVTEYDRDGVLDWSVHGTDWHRWFEWRMGQLKDADPVYARAVVKQELIEKFTNAVEFALNLGV